MIQSKLKNYRTSKNISQIEIAKRVSMDQTTYSKKENGKSPINEEEWKRIAKVLDVAVEDIKLENEPITIKNENCTFRENAIGIQYVNIPQNVFDIIIKYNTKLEEENLKLKKEVEKFS
jgi:transcriptional regulator with XRE-family HTH domain